MLNEGSERLPGTTSKTCQCKGSEGFSSTSTRICRVLSYHGDLKVNFLMWKKYNPDIQIPDYYESFDL
jgi:hypothetical protein